MKTKVSYYLSHPIQYFSPLLREMALQFDLHVYYFSDASIKGNLDVGFGQNVKWDIPLLEGYSYTFLKNISPRKSLSNRMWDVINPSVVTTLYKDGASIVIVNGWSYFSTVLTVTIAKILGKKVWLRAENPLNQELVKSKLLLKLKKVILKYLLFPFINKFLYIGIESRKFFEFYGAKPSQLIFTPYAVDNNFFQEKHNQLNEKEHVKKQLKLPSDKKIILFSGKYINKKRPMDLIEAFRLLNNPKTTLVMVGEGILRNEMETLIKKFQIENIILTGFINQSEIVKYYAVADIFVLCSGPGETWGLSVNEAMNFSLPIVASNICGCTADLVKDGINGFQFMMGDISNLSHFLEILLINETLRITYGKESLKIIDDYSISNIVQNLVKTENY